METTTKNVNDIEETKGNKFAENFNKKYGNLNKVEGQLIEIVREVVKTNSDKILKAFKNAVICDRSVLNRYLKVAKCEFINDNLDQLPSAVSVLIKIAQSDEEVMQAMLDEGVLNTTTTLSQLKEEMKAYATDDEMTDSEEPLEEVVESQTTSLSHKMIESEEELDSVLKMTIDFKEVFDHEDVYPSKYTEDFENFIDEIADRCTKTYVLQVLWEALVEVKMAHKGDIEYINQERLNRKTRGWGINALKEAA